MRQSPRPPSQRALCTPSPSVGPVLIRCRMYALEWINLTFWNIMTNLNYIIDGIHALTTFNLENLSMKI